MKPISTGTSTSSASIAGKTVYAILFAVSFSHLLNDLLQSTIPAIYPMLKDKYRLSFAEIGMITFTFQLTASILQPFVGFYTDRRPRPYSLLAAMLFTAGGLVLLAYAASFPVILMAVALVGIGSSIFHPEASRVAYLASGGRRGFAQSIFQLGGNAGSATGPLLIAIVVMPYGQYNIVWFVLAALLAILVLTRIAAWYRGHLNLRAASGAPKETPVVRLSPAKITLALTVLLVLIFSKYFYMTSITSYLTFYLIDKFQLSPQQSQMYLFVFLASIAAGTVIGGPIGDRFGRKYVIWISILGVAPFTMLLPYVNLFWLGILIVIIGIILASAFSAILVYAQELVPGKVGMISGLFFGFAFGVAGLGSALLGYLADHTSIEYVFKVCAYLPLIGIITGLLPGLNRDTE
ncbi:MFS transporter [Taibaiella chishuiensis]|uniref:FSR family fosmidomycin resistance protein-like MFS transporter n=1 Tax=Taibaiella chishuiensis TaxID=1434707 RepID=A0A2P8D7W3_9BACT|nr:MFS transporter [Taibaiella chishuiensis]PSK93325.1 FSR family fosmidomycin resistance protein-like MFS transporter [Taibaiella chishuiensis]